MVGTSATVAFLARSPSTARRNAGTVRAIMGVRGIRNQSVGDGGSGVRRARAESDIIKPVAPPPSAGAGPWGLVAERRSLRRFAGIVGSITDCAEQVGILD